MGLLDKLLGSNSGTDVLGLLQQAGTVAPSVNDLNTRIEDRPVPDRTRPPSMGNSLLDFLGSGDPTRVGGPVNPGVSSTEEAGAALREGVDHLVGGAQLIPGAVDSVLDVARGPTTDFFAGVFGDTPPIDLTDLGAPNPGETPEEQAQKSALIASTAQADADGRNTGAVAALPTDATVPEIQEAKNKDMTQDGVDDAKASGYWSKTWEEGWKNFTDKVDLFTLGTSLLASNDGSKSFAQNLGAAMAAGAAAKTGQTQLAIKNARDLQEDANTLRDTASREKMAEAAMIRSQRSGSTAAGLDFPSTVEQGVINDLMDAKLVKTGFDAKLSPEARANLQTQINTAAQLAPAGTDPSDLVDRVWNSMGLVDESSFFNPVTTLGLP
jgi:hypothetical protein